MTISVRDVEFSYGRRRVFESISVDIGVGSTLLLGPNGAGKSTLLELMAAVRRPAHGSVSVGTADGRNLGSEDERAYKGSVSWLPQAIHPYPGVTVREHVALSGWMKGMPRASAWEASATAVSAVDLDAQSGDSVRKLSGGQLRRLGIAGALVHDARVVLLDEPTAGLDPAQRRNFREVLTGLAKDRTVVVASHDTEGAEGAYDRVIVLVDGQIRFSGSLSEFVAHEPETASISEKLERAYTRFTRRVDA